MKKPGIITVVLLLVLLAACSFNRRRHTTIVEKDNNHYFKIEYAGRIAFNNAGTAIQSISPDGYLEYQYNDLKLDAKNNGNGGISYELHEGYSTVNPQYRSQFIANAVKVMMQKCKKNGVVLN